MGKINGCLKCVFVFFNVLFVLVGCLLIFVAVKTTTYAAQMSSFGGPSVGWIWVFTIGVFGISCLGIYAACSEKLLALKIFAGFMGVGMIIMLILGIIVAVFRNKVKEGLQGDSDAFIQEYMKNEDFRLLISIMQEPFQCCGVRNAKDWGETIPDSCECKNSLECKPKPVGYSGPLMIYSKSCGEKFFDTLDMIFKLAMGIYFGFCITALLGLLFSLLMIRQVSRHDGAGGPSMAMKGY